MRPYSLFCLAPLCGVLLAGGCFITREQGQAMQREIDELKRRLATDKERSKLEREKLQKVMEQATALLTRNSADVGAQVDRMQAKVDQVGGQMEELEKKVNDVAQQFTEFKAKVDVKLEGLQSGAPGPQNPPVPEEKNELFNQASSKLAAGDHAEARRLLRHFVSRFAADPRVDRAQLMLGESYFAEQKFAPAIVEYKKIIEEHKQSAVVPEALYKIGMAFYQLKFCSDANLFLSQLLKKHKNHAQAERAKKVLALIKRFKRDRNVCRP